MGGREGDLENKAARKNGSQGKSQSAGPRGRGSGCEAVRVLPGVAIWVNVKGGDFHQRREL